MSPVVPPAVYNNIYDSRDISVRQKTMGRACHRPHIAKPSFEPCARVDRAGYPTPSTSVRVLIAHSGKRRCLQAVDYTLFAVCLDDYSLENEAELYQDFVFPRTCGLLYIPVASLLHDIRVGPYHI